MVSRVANELVVKSTGVGQPAGLNLVSISLISNECFAPRSRELQMRCQPKEHSQTDRQTDKEKRTALTNIECDTLGCRMHRGVYLFMGLVYIYIYILLQ